MSLVLLSFVIPACTLSFVLMSVKTPSSALFVFGMCSCGYSWYVHSHGMFRLRLRYALLSLWYLYLVLCPFPEEVPPSVMPPVQVLTELLLAGPCHSTCQFKQFSGRRQFRIAGEVSAYYHHLVELTHLHGVWPEGLKKATHAVTDYAIDDKSILPELFNSFHIGGNRLMTDKLVPEDLVTEGILDDQQAKIATPIGRIHVDDHILVPGNDTDMAHGLQTTPYRALGHAITAGKLGKGLLAFNIFTDKYLIVNAGTTNELTTAGLTFIALLTTTENVLYCKTTTTIKAIFLPYYVK